MSKHSCISMSLCSMSKAEERTSSTTSSNSVTSAASADRYAVCYLQSTFVKEALVLLHCMIVWRLIFQQRERLSSRFSLWYTQEIKEEVQEEHREYGQSLHLCAQQCFWGGKYLNLNWFTVEVKCDTYETFLTYSDTFSRNLNDSIKYTQRQKWGGSQNTNKFPPTWSFRCCSTKLGVSAVLGPH